MGARGVPPARIAPPTSATPTPPGSGCRGSASSTRAPERSPASWPPGESAPRPTRTARSARCSPTRRWSSSPSATRRTSARSSRSAASTPRGSGAAARRSSRRSRAARRQPADPARGPRGRSDPEDAPLIVLAEALLRARALEAGLAYELIASRSELEQIVAAARRGEPEPEVRTLEGWRSELVGRRPARPAGRTQGGLGRTGPPPHAQLEDAPTSSTHRHRRRAVEHRVRQREMIGHGRLI